MTSRALTHLFIALALLTGSIGVYAFAYYQVVSESKRSAELESQIQMTIESAVKAAETSDTLVALAEDERVIREYYVSLAGIVPFLERIEGTGRSIGSAVQVVSVSDKPGSDGRITLTLRIIGSFEAVLRTLGAIEYGPYDSRITSLTFDTPATGGAWTAAATFSVATDAVPTK